jgi:glycerate kinase
MEICEIAKETIPRFFPDCKVESIPVADGGEGTVACFQEAIGAQQVVAQATGPYGEPIEAVYARKGELAVMEMAAVAGLPMVGERKDPEKTTTYGLGQMILHGVKSGCGKLLLGLGGSATNDGGCGCAAALGVKFFDESGTPFVPVGETLKNICRIDASEAKELLKDIQITVMCDVDNPLCGPTGAAAVFGPQKGADREMVQRLDQGLEHLAKIIRRDLGCEVDKVPGSGAAGGLGAGCMAFLGAELRSGIEAVLDAVDFDARVTDADLVITGEGCIDSQSVHGKVISGIAGRTAPRKIPLVAIVGGIADGAEEAYDLGVTAMFSINRKAEPLEVSGPKSKENYQRTLEDILRLL